MYWTTSFGLPFRARRSESCGARARLQHAVPYLQAWPCQSCHQGDAPSGKFKEFEYGKCGRVTRITHDYDKVEEQTYSYNSLGLPVEECCGTHLMERSDEKHGLIVSLRSSPELSSAMSVMLMASWFDSGQTKAKDLTFDYAVYGSTSPLKIELTLVWR